MNRIVIWLISALIVIGAGSAYLLDGPSADEVAADTALDLQDAIQQARVASKEQK